MVGLPAWEEARAPGPSLGDRVASDPITEVPDPTPQESEEPEGTVDPKEPDDRLTFAKPVPRPCARTSDPSREALASYSRGKVTIADLDGSVRATASGNPPLELDGSASRLFFGRGRVLLARGPAGDLFDARPDMWKLVTREGVCSFSSTGGDLTVMVVEGRSEVPLLPEGALGGRVRDIVTAGDGTAAAIVARGDDGDRLWWVDLRGGMARLRLVSEVRIELGGWVGDRVSYATQGGPTRLLARSGGPGRRVGRVAPDSIVACGGDLVGLGGQGVGPLVRLHPGRAPSVLAPGPFRSFTCASSGAYLAAVPDDSRQLQLIRADGSALQSFAPEAGLIDDAPLWGPPGAGLVYVRSVRGEKRGTLWHIPDGAGPRSTSIVVDRVDGRWAFDWPAASRS
jgi:hypothetical protein